MDELLSNIQSFFKQGLSLFVILSFSLLFYLYLNQGNMLFATSVGGTRYLEDNPDPYKSPSQLGLNFIDTTVETEDKVKLKGWLVYVLDIRLPTLVYFHENAGSKDMVCNCINGLLL